MISELFHIAVWYLMILFLGIAALPITSFVCKNLPDRGYSVSKILGILIISYSGMVPDNIIPGDSRASDHFLCLQKPP